MGIQRVLMEVVRYGQLQEMFEAEKTLESGVKADFKVLGLSNWKDGMQLLRWKD